MNRLTSSINHSSLTLCKTHNLNYINIITNKQTEYSIVFITDRHSFIQTLRIYRIIALIKHLIYTI